MHEAVGFARRVHSDPNVKKLCFAPIRFFVNVPNIDDYSTILQLKDPRDVLVPMFYSYCYMHSGAVKVNTGYRKRIADEGIDSFVIKMDQEDHPDIVGDYGTGNHLIELIGCLRVRYSDYVYKLVGKDNVTFVTYEDMVTDFGSWAGKVVNGFYFRDEERVKEELVAKHASGLKVDREDIWSHKRKITPGDHKNKLRSETIDELNRIFKDILPRLDYNPN